MTIGVFEDAPPFGPTALDNAKIACKEKLQMEQKVF